MASSLYGLARKVSEYVRNRHSRQYRRADDAIDDSPKQSSYKRSRRGLYDRFKTILFGRDRGDEQDDPATSPTAPPRPDQPEPAAPVDLRKLWPGQQEDDGFGPELGQGEIQILGRDVGYDEADFEAVMEAMRRTPGSSNVYGYFFEREARRTGILYVTFLAQRRGQTGSGPGPTYAYYDVPVKKAVEFQRATQESAGGAVWDYLRIRGTIAGHQHQYRLVHVSGEYVPRKVTPLGYKNRAVPALGVGRRSFRRNTLPEQKFFSRGGPNRGGPDRGEPDRGN